MFSLFKQKDDSGVPLRLCFFLVDKVRVQVWQKYLVRLCAGAHCKQKDITISRIQIYNCIVFQLLPNAEILRVMAMFGVCLKRNDAFVAKNSRCLNYLFHITVPSD